MNAAVDTSASSARKPIEALPPPSLARGPIAWVRENLFSGPLNTLLTLAVALPPLRPRSADRPSSCSSTRSGPARTATPAAPRRRGARSAHAGPSSGTGSTTSSTAPIRSTERWRVNVFFVLLAIGVGWLLWLKAPRRDLGARLFLRRLPDRVVLSPHRRLLARPGARCRRRSGAASSSRCSSRRSASSSRCRSASCWRSGGARSCRSCSWPR